LVSKTSVTKYRALIDTSSLVTHDLCAQLHVLQFCVTELESFVSSGGEEFLEKMGDSTRHLSEIINTFRRQLKVTLNNEDPTSFKEIHAAVMDLLKNHFYAVFERVDFSFEGDLSKLKVKHNSRKYMNVLFSIYATMIDHLKEGDFLETDKVHFYQNVIEENKRFLNIKITVPQHSFKKEWFLKKINEGIPEKGKMRILLGLSILKEALEEGELKFFVVTKADETVIEVHLPLEVH